MGFVSVQERFGLVSRARKPGISASDSPGSEGPNQAPGQEGEVSFLSLRLISRMQFPCHFNFNSDEAKEATNEARPEKPACRPKPQPTSRSQNARRDTWLHHGPWQASSTLTLGLAHGPLCFIFLCSFVKLFPEP